MKRQHIVVDAPSDGLPTTKRPRTNCHRQGPAISYYVVRSSSMIEEPIIFFGWKDLNLFEEYLQQQQSRSQEEENVTTLAYQEFDNLANALEYVQTTSPGTTEEQQKENDDTTATKPQTEPEPRHNLSNAEENFKMTTEQKANDQEQDAENEKVAAALDTRSGSAPSDSPNDNNQRRTKPPQRQQQDSASAESPVAAAAPKKVTVTRANQRRTKPKTKPKTKQRQQASTKAASSVTSAAAAAVVAKPKNKAATESNQRRSKRQRPLQDNAKEASPARATEPKSKVVTEANQRRSKRQRLLQENAKETPPASATAKLKTQAVAAAANRQDLEPTKEELLFVLQWARQKDKRSSRTTKSDNQTTARNSSKDEGAQPKPASTTVTTGSPQPKQPPPPPTEEDKQKAHNNNNNSIVKKRGGPQGKRFLVPPQPKQPPPPPAAEEEEASKQQSENNNNGNKVAEARGRPRGKRFLAPEPKQTPPTEEAQEPGPMQQKEQPADDDDNNMNNTNRVKRKPGRPKGKRSTWEERFQLLVEFKQEYGHLKVPSQSDALTEKYVPLRVWTRRQRKEFSNLNVENKQEISLNDSILMERRQRLQDLGFLAADPKQPSTLEAPEQEEQPAENSNRIKRKPGGPKGKRSTWEERFQLLLEFKQEYGHLKIPSKSAALTEKYVPLRAWTQRQRKELTNLNVDNTEEMSLNDSLMMERRQRLQDIGFVLKYRPNKVTRVTQEFFNQQFEKYYQQLKDFKAEHGHVNLPHGTTLRNWVFVQRKAYHTATTASTTQTPNVNQSKSFLTLEHITALKELGVSMELNFTCSDRWQAVQDYVNFVKAHNRLPKKYSSDYAEHRLGCAGDRWRQERGIFAQPPPPDHVSPNAAAATTNATKKNPPMPQELIEALDSVGFPWVMKHKPRPARRRSDFNLHTPWETKFQALKDYIAKYGMEPTMRHKALGDFVAQIRKDYNHMVQGKRTYMTLERFQKLTNAGFRFKVGRQRRYGFKGSDGESSGGEGGEEEAEEEQDDGFFGSAANHHQHPNDLWAAYARRPV